VPPKADNRLEACHARHDARRAGRRADDAPAESRIDTQVAREAPQLCAVRRVMLHSHAPATSARRAIPVASARLTPTCTRELRDHWLHETPRDVNGEALEAQAAGQEEEEVRFTTGCAPLACPTTLCVTRGTLLRARGGRL